MIDIYLLDVKRVKMVGLKLVLKVLLSHDCRILRLQKRMLQMQEELLWWLG
jgi:hypothetical protein